jgi:hypothetical protein
LFGDPGDFVPGGIQLGLEIGGRDSVDPATVLAPASAVGKRFRQA